MAGPIHLAFFLFPPLSHVGALEKIMVLMVRSKLPAYLSPPAEVGSKLQLAEFQGL